MRALEGALGVGDVLEVEALVDVDVNAAVRDRRDARIDPLDLRHRVQRIEKKIAAPEERPRALGDHPRATVGMIAQRRRRLDRIGAAAGRVPIERRRRDVRRRRLFRFCLLVVTARLSGGRPVHEELGRR